MCKTLMALGTASLLLAGCGAAPGGIAPQAIAPQTLAARATRSTRLYGLNVQGTIAAVKVLSPSTVQLVVDVTAADNGNFSGRITLGDENGTPIQRQYWMTAGAPVATFINYPLVDMQAHKILPDSQPYQAGAITQQAE